MGHKGVSQRKPKKVKEKTSATANHGGAVTGLSQGGSAAIQSPGKARIMPSGKSGMNPAAGANQGGKKH